MRRAAAFACVLLLAAGVSAQGDLPPYIYYPADGGYIIERADGTDSHIITAELDPDIRSFGGEWSASGRWVAWEITASEACGMEPGPNGLILAGADGTADWSYAAVKFAWSPVIDRLLILSAGAEPQRVTWQIVDPTTPDRPLATSTLAGVIATMRIQWIGETAVVYWVSGVRTQFALIGPDLQVRETAYDFPVIALLPAGQALADDSDRGGIVVEQLDLPDGPLGEPSGPDVLPFSWEQNDERRIFVDALYSHPLEWDFVQVLGDGRFLFRTPDGLLIRDTSTGVDDPIAWDYESYSSPQISPDERLIAHIYDGPVIVDRATGGAVYLPPTVLSFKGNLGGRVKWHPTRNWLISEEAGPAYCAGTSFTQVTDGTYRREIEACGSDANCVRWLPEHVDQSQFPPYERPSEPRPYAVLNAGDWVTTLAWSEDGRTLFAWGEVGALAAFPATVGETASPADTPPRPERTTGFYDDYGLLAESEHYAATLAGVFDKRIGVVVLTYDDAMWQGGARFTFSADERFMISAGMTQPLRVWSLEDMRLVYEGLTTTAAAISGDSRLVAVAAGWEVRLYDLSALVDRR